MSSLAEETRAVFLDTTVQIARFVGTKQSKKEIRQKLIGALPLTGLVVRQEWKRRLLTDAKYVLGVLRQKNLSYAETLQHINRKLTSNRFLGRKLSICLDLLATGLGSEASDAGERLENYLIMLLEDGLSLFDVTAELVRTSNCGCALQDILIDHSGTYNLGPLKCSSAGSCGVSKLFDLNHDSLRSILREVKALPEKEKTDELASAELLIERYLNGEVEITSESPCLRYGDITISLESKGIQKFFTANVRESTTLCAAMNQKMLVFSVS